MNNKKEWIESSRFFINIFYIIFIHINLTIDDTWIDSTSFGTESTVKNNTGHVGEVDSTRTTEISTEKEDENSIDNNRKDIRAIDVPFVSVVGDNTFTNLRKNEESGKTNAVQNVLGEFQQIVEEHIIDSASDTESNMSEDENSLSYIADRVEKVDLLNFDDSDVSIADDEEEDFI